MRHTGRLARLLALATTLAITMSCSDSRDARLAEFARRSLDDQGRQNERIAEQSRQIARASRELVHADAQTRKQMIESQAALQREIESARTNVDQQKSELDRERREMALHRYRDPVIGQALIGIGLTVACLLPLCLAAYVLYTFNRYPSESAELGELLVTEIVADEPLLLSFLPAKGIESRRHEGMPAEAGLDEDD